MSQFEALKGRPWPSCQAGLSFELAAGSQKDHFFGKSLIFSFHKKNLARWEELLTCLG